MYLDGVYVRYLDGAYRLGWFASPCLQCSTGCVDGHLF